MGALKAEVVVVLGIALAAVYLTTRAASAVANTASNLWDGAKDVASTSLNPTSDQNIAYQGASSLARWLTGQETGDLGTIVWDYVHKGEPDPVTGQPMNYTKEQQAADLKAIQQLEAGYHGM